MKALVITIPRERWPADMTNHWHIVDTHISRHLLGSVQVNYPDSRITEVEWDNFCVAPTCDECGQVLGGTNG
jgi:hypothetical protein